MVLFFGYAIVQRYLHIRVYNNLEGTVNKLGLSRRVTGQNTVSCQFILSSDPLSFIMKNNIIGLKKHKYISYFVGLAIYFIADIRFLLKLYIFKRLIFIYITVNYRFCNFHYLYQKQ